ncbi:tryptophanyl-tRNA synthetase [Pluteus cervinus]|uniref:Tryptophanyl-tRNA synthetase n=1 Tax=Pluteus cervinus TaxID=181527 RepID=A0ACD3AM28_9AGAR|nr:tryptophanyl-tRNA synthetase [Pluteus cervinus]
MVGASTGTKRVVLSGIQPTGVPHLGNYLGAMTNWVRLERTSSPQDELLYTVVGWHALTLPQDPKALMESRIDMLATLLAIGLDPKRSVIFHQDQVRGHTELAWILSCLTPVGWLRRMTTWKSRLATSRNANDESEVDESLLNAGLLTYPVLQAADILLYKATHVPVGDDQTQHLQLTRDIADHFNRTFKQPHQKHPYFPLPTQVDTPTKRILSLKDPSSKMSKSAPDIKSRILLTDTAPQIQTKLRSAVTDSIHGITFDPVNRPGISNLLTILSACSEEPIEQVVERCRDYGHAQLKTEVADAVEEMVREPREKFERLRKERGYLEQVAKEGAEKAGEKAEKTMNEVRKLIGLA